MTSKNSLTHIFVYNKQICMIAPLNIHTHTHKHTPDDINDETTKISDRHTHTHLTFLISRALELYLVYIVSTKEKKLLTESITLWNESLSFYL